MNIKIEFGFGIRWDKDHRPIALKFSWDAVKAIRKKASELYGGCTLLDTVGDWVNPVDGVCHSEAGHCLVVYETEGVGGILAQRRRRQDMIDFIKQALNQAAVAVCVTKVDFEIL